MIFWDLDGPILDVKEKYYSVYKDILLRNGDIPLPRDDYWVLKRSKTAVVDILLKSNCSMSPDIFGKFWIERIETPEYLELDSLQPGIIEILLQCKQKTKLVMVTLRRSREMLLYQLDQLNIIHFFDDILCSSDNIKPRWKIKFKLIKNYINGIENKYHIIIGDTETDIIAGNKLGFKTIAVLCGIRNEDLLKTKPSKYYYKSSSIMENFS